MSFKYIDAHCHLQDKQFDIDRDEVIQQMLEQSVAGIVIGTDSVMSDKAVVLATEYDFLWATVGVHPTDTHTEIFDVAKYTTLASNPKVVAIGECGLDYYWPDRGGWKDGEAGEKKRQHDLFEQQVILAKALNKPLVIHGRPRKGSMDAYEDILDILSRHSGARGDVHFFVGTLDIAQKFISLGFTLSFTAVITFARDYDEVVKSIPLASILSETDAPYVAPASRRGHRNDPLAVVEVVHQIALIRGEDPEMVREALVANAKRLFAL